MICQTPRINVFNLMPCLPFRQTVCQVLFAWDSPHFYSSRLGHLLQPQIPQFHVSSLTETSSRRCRFGSVGISPNLHLGGHAQVCHHRLHSKSLCCTRDDCVIHGFCRTQCSRRLRTPDLPLSTSGFCPIRPKPSSTRQFPLRTLYSRPSSLSTSGFCPINPKPSNNAVFVAALVLQTFLCPRQVSAQSIPNLRTTRCLSLTSYSRPSSVHVRCLPNQFQTFQQRGVCRCPRTLSTSSFCPVNPKPSNNAVFVAAHVLQTFLSVHVRFLPNQSQTFQQRGVCRCPRTPDLPMSTSGVCPINPKPSNNAVFVAALVLQTFLCPRQVSAQSIPNLPTTRCLSLPSCSRPSSVHVRFLPSQPQTFQQRGVCRCPRIPEIPLSTSGFCPINPKPSNNAVFVAALVLQTFLCPRQVSASQPQTFHQRGVCVASLELQTFLCPRQVSAQSTPNLPTTRCLSLPSYSRPSSVHVRFLPNQSQTFQQRDVCRCPRTPDLPLSTSGFCPIHPKPSNNAVFVAALVLQTCPRQDSAQSVPRFLPNQSQTFQQRRVCRCPRTPNLPLSTSGFCPINPKPSNNAVFAAALVLQTFLCPRQVSAQTIPNLPTTRCLPLPSYSRPSSLSSSGFCPIHPKPSNNAVFVAAIVLQTFLCPRQVSAQSIPNLPTTRCLSLPSYFRNSSLSSSGFCPNNPKPSNNAVFAAALLLQTFLSVLVRFLPKQSQTFQQRGVCRCPRLCTSGFCPINPKPSNNAVFVAALVLQTFLCPRQVSAQSIPNLPTTRCLSLPSYSRPSSLSSSGFCPIHPQPSNNAVFVAALVLQTFLSVHVRFLPNPSQTFQQRGVCRCPRTPDLPLSTSGFCRKPSNNAVFAAALVLQTFLSVLVRFLPNPSQTFQQRGVCRCPRTPDLPLCPRQVSAQSNLPTTRCLSLPSYSRPSSVLVKFLPKQSQTFQQCGVCRCPRTPDLPLSTSGFCPLVLQTFLCPRQVSAQSIPNLPTTRCLSLPSYSRPSSLSTSGFCPNNPKPSNNAVFVAALVLQTFLSVHVRFLPNPSQTFQQRGVCRCPRTPDLPLSTSGFCPIKTFQQRGVCPKPSNNAVFVAALVLQTFLSVLVRFLPYQSQTFQQRGVCRFPRTPDLPLSTSGFCPVNPQPSNNAVAWHSARIRAFCLSNLPSLVTNKFLADGPDWHL